ncbi:MAG: NAD(P)(+) transhydrogenase (Re/Si-specific) subunit beta, partial [Planctomycetota bacterium]
MAFWTTIFFLAGGVCFIFGLKLLSRTSTARLGNLVSALGMSLAILGAGLKIVERFEASGALPGLGTFIWILLGIILGAAVGIPAARLVKMTSMPEMVALFNGFGGIASLLVGWSQLHSKAASLPEGRTMLSTLSDTGSPYMVSSTIFLAMLIGGVTFTGSLVAFGKLSGKIASRPILYEGQQKVNALVLLLVVLAGVWFTMSPGHYWLFLLATAVSLFVGVAVVIPIGGADMPV